MSLPTTAAAILVVILGVLPGIPGDHVYRLMVGVSWREKDWRHILRILSFSLLGLVVYTLLADFLGWHLPAYVIPGTFASPTFSPALLAPLSQAYLGHLCAATAVGLMAALTMRGLAKVSPVSSYRDAWDQFVNFTVPEHWVLVTLNGGETFAGLLDHADVAVEPEFRDLILSEPFQYSKDKGIYVPTMNQHLFLRGRDVASIAVVYDANVDKRVVAVDGDPFKRGTND